MAFLVEISEEAQQEADAILTWLMSQHAGEAGVRWMLAMDDAIGSLAIFLGVVPWLPRIAGSRSR
jgi:hypothetical protein